MIHQRIKNKTPMVDIADVPLTHLEPEWTAPIHGDGAHLSASAPEDVFGPGDLAQPTCKAAGLYWSFTGLRATCHPQRTGVGDKYSSFPTSRQDTPGAGLTGLLRRPTWGRAQLPQQYTELIRAPYCWFYSLISLPQLPLLCFSESLPKGTGGAKALA